MIRDNTGWIAECASCQKVRARDPGTVAVPIGSFSIFEEILVDYMGLLYRTYFKVKNRISVKGDFLIVLL